MNPLRLILLVGLAFAPLAQVGGQPSPPVAAAKSRVSLSEQALQLYSALTHRTILRPGNFPRLSDSLLTRMMEDTNAAAAVVERELAEKHFEVVRDGDLFVRFLPEGWQSSALAAQLLRIPAPPKRAPAQKEDPASAFSTPPGTIDFRGVDINQVLAIYSSLHNRTVLRPRRLSGPVFVLRNETPLTREETVYALNVILALNGFAAVDDGINFVQVVPVQDLALVQTRAPKPKLTDPLVEPNEVPVFVSNGPVYPPPSSLSSAEAADHLAPPPTGSPPPGVDELVAYYAKLLGKKPSQSPFHQQLVSFKVQTALTKAELLYAIETTLALDGLKIERQEDGTLQAAAR